MNIAMAQMLHKRSESPRDKLTITTSTGATPHCSHRSESGRLAILNGLLDSSGIGAFRPVEFASKPDGGVKGGGA